MGLLSYKELLLSKNKSRTDIEGLSRVSASLGSCSGGSRLYKVDPGAVKVQGKVT